MDMSKLPRLSESPAPPQTAQPVLATPTQRRLGVMEAGIDLLIGCVVGTIFLMQGAPFGGWLIARMRGLPYDTGNVWNSGDKAGQPVELFDLLLGTGWLYMGEWILGALVLLATLFLALTMVAPTLKRFALVMSIACCVLGALANIYAIIMQIQMGFSQPIMSVFCVLVAGLMAFFLARHLMPPATE